MQQTFIGLDHHHHHHHRHHHACPLFLTNKYVDLYKFPRCYILCEMLYPTTIYIIHLYDIDGDVDGVYDAIKHPSVQAVLHKT
jgi:hypothetical protein